MSKVTLLPPLKRAAVSDITDKVIRAKQILRAITIAQEHDEVECHYAFEQVEDMLDEASTVDGVTDQIIRAKQIVKAVRISQEHDEFETQYALEQVVDLLEAAGQSMGELE